MGWEGAEGKGKKLASVGVLLVGVEPDLTHEPTKLFDVPHALLLLVLEHAEEERALALAVYKAARDADPEHGAVFDAPVYAHLRLGHLAPPRDCTAHRVQDLRAWQVVTQEHRVQVHLT